MVLPTGNDMQQITTGRLPFSTHSHGNNTLAGRVVREFAPGTDATASLCKNSFLRVLTTAPSFIKNLGVLSKCDLHQVRIQEWQGFIVIL